MNFSVRELTFLLGRSAFVTLSESIGETNATGATEGISTALSVSLNGFVISGRIIFGERKGLVLFFSDDENGFENLVSLGEVGERGALEENGLKGFVLKTAVGDVVFLSTI